MVPSIGNSSSLAAVAASSAQKAASAPNPAAASQVIKDSLNISQQAQAASARMDSDGDHDGS